MHLVIHIYIYFCRHSIYIIIHIHVCGTPIISHSVAWPAQGFALAPALGAWALLRLQRAAVDWHPVCRHGTNNAGDVELPSHSKKQNKACTQNE